MAEQVHIDAVARAISVPDWGAWSDTAHPDHNRWTWDGDGRTDGEREFLRDEARAVLNSGDPRVHEAMLAALVEHGVLRKSVRLGWRGRGDLLTALCADWREVEP